MTRGSLVLGASVRWLALSVVALESSGLYWSRYWRDSLESLQGGIVSLDERLIADIVTRIRSVASPRRILVFGSAAVGSMTPDSDIDLLVLEDGAVDARADRLRIRQALRGLGWAFDVIVMTTERFDETKGVVGTIAHPADRQGHVVYEAA